MGNTYLLFENAVYFHGLDSYEEILDSRNDLDGDRALGVSGRLYVYL